MNARKFLPLSLSSPPKVSTAPSEEAVEAEGLHSLREMSSRGRAPERFPQPLPGSTGRRCLRLGRSRQGTSSRSPERARSVTRP